MSNKPLTIAELEIKAKEIRRLIIQMLAKAGSGHPGGIRGISARQGDSPSFSSG